ncbi:FAM96B protein [Pluteus cervinus]|uniref:FAM96B protein n=1 Tax=Pluteus cervinus TaxID=181527 RepID=A0ACD3B2F5_9AGAR|nr:FAM96B protein [Pluteus cervinus]
MAGEIYNPNPTIFSPAQPAGRKSDFSGESLWIDEKVETHDDTDEVEPIDAEEIYGLIRTIYDPEHPNTLEELRIVSLPQINVNKNHVRIEFTPTIPHCGASTQLGLSIRVRLLRSLPARFKVDIYVKPGSHVSEHALNKQLNDKERVAAALENQALLSSVEQTLRAFSGRV